VVRFDPRPICEIEGVEDLEGSTLETVCLAVEDLDLGQHMESSRVLGDWIKSDFGSSLVDDSGPATKSTHPIGHH
jgi:hypothetical protein